MKKAAVLMYWLITAAAFAAVVARVFWDTPEEATMGIIQKIFYIHLPVAINTFVACLLVFVASVGYLTTRRVWWDDLAMAAAKVSPPCTSELTWLRISSSLGFGLCPLTILSALTSGTPAPIRSLIWR